MIYMIALIKDLDNPFDHYDNGKAAARVSLKPIKDIEEKLKKMNSHLDK